eukprot:TRINITY_DN2761_c0_g1_i3.p1 TRINITY_DN2761_c0_g1~~TRINITY_DN2761_c0_g1_i3.p1  ORF type:complete len:987 (-),score=308.24 TRINITY_DN2761_c0_g1_i3:8-2968(-)
MSLLDDFDMHTAGSDLDTSMQDDAGLMDMNLLETADMQLPLTATYDEEPMITLEKVEYKPNGLQYMAVCNEMLVMALNNNHIIRLNLESPQDLEDIEISRRSEDKIHKIFLDPTGSHLLISMANEDNYYIHSSWKKPKLIPKLKGHVITSMAWDMYHQNSTTSVSVLLGTSRGRLYETTIEATEKRFMEFMAGGAREQVLKQVYCLPEPAAITGLRVERFPPSPSEATKFFVLATTNTRIYQFIGGPTFENLFSNYQVNPSFQELPGDLQRSELVFYAKHQGLLRSFAWLTGPGIFHGGITYGSQNPGDTVTTDTQLLPFPERDSRGMPIPPLSIDMTEFHFLILYEHKFIVISKLSGQTVFSTDFVPRFRGLAHDHTRGTLWLYGEGLVYELVLRGEDRDVWRQYLDKGQFEDALEYCKEPGKKEKQDKVWATQADHFFQLGKYSMAAGFYGKTQRVFEEITLKFININERDALKAYLTAKLQNIGKRDATQRTIICTWLTEMYANKLNQLHDANQMEQYADMKEEFRHFLKEYKDHIDPPTTFHIISSHGCIDELLLYAALIEDYQRVISHYIQHNEYKKALSVLSKLGQAHEDLFYQVSPVLMMHAPYDTVNCWMKASFLDPRKLIPALMRYDPVGHPSSDGTHQGIRYLQHCVRNLNNTDPAIHNYLLSLYAKQPEQGELLDFLRQDETFYDKRYALRLCTKEGKLEACVLIYSAMGLYEEAVDLALKVNIELAKQNADKPEDDDPLRKKLWLRIARHVVAERRDVKEAVAFLNHTDLLQIEDVLPFFPDFVLIDDFKEEICKSLEDYNRHIDELKTEMDEATHSADLIRLDIKDLRNKYGYVGAQQRCEVCHYGVLTRSFYLFPCQHVFHADCLVAEILPLLNAPLRVRVRDIQNKLATLQYESTTTRSAPAREDSEGGSSSSSSSSSTSMSASTPAERLKGELDTLVASECPLCGDIMLRSIDKPFVAPDEIDAKRSWAI